ncbi:unnamed protein product [Gemmata massiliana]|uniref:Uncharacterized protein n=1 Tax=Gemmata massiliana TaxID=1210884 RepID=A0A6P2D6W4_9BACT|nr:hypothetical protein [Gemmata massiliana]VTR96196.1 unnamed protein product [Gemmata massiliana]
MEMQAAIDSIRAVWSDCHVCQVTREFLAKCEWKLEVGEGWIEVPADAELLVYSAAVIVSDHGFGDHIEAIVYLGVQRVPPTLFPVHGVLRLYLNPAGQMVTEDRYSLAEWVSNRA